MCNQNNNDNLDDLLKGRNENNKNTLRIIAFAIALCLLIMFILPIFKNINLPSLEFLKESIKLNQEPEVKEYKKAIVTIKIGNTKGTGFNIDKKGLIVTNAHVVKNKDYVYVNFKKGKRYKGKVYKLYSDLDLALIDIEGTRQFPKLDLDQNNRIKRGDEVLIIGNPLKFNGVANKGSIYGLAKMKDFDKPILLIKAPINKGNSGSPVINKDGQVIGIIFATIKNNGEKDKKLGAAIPVKYLINRL